MSASNDAGRNSVTFHFATTNMAGDKIPMPEVMPGNDPSETGIAIAEQSDWILAVIVGVIIFAASFLMYVLLS